MCFIPKLGVFLESMLSGCNYKHQMPGGDVTSIFHDRQQAAVKSSQKKNKKNFPSQAVQITERIKPKHRVCVLQSLVPLTTAVKKKKKNPVI